MKTGLLKVVALTLMLSMQISCGRDDPEALPTELEISRQAPGPDVPLIRSKGDVFISDRFAMSIRKPRGWHAQTPDDMLVARDRGADILATGSKTARQAQETANARTFHLVSFFQTPPGKPVPFNANLAVIVEDISHAPSIQSGSDYLRALKSGLTKTALNYSFEPTPAKITIDGKDFDRLVASLSPASDIEIRQEYASYVSGGFVICLIMTYMNDAQHEDIEKAIRTMTLDWD